MTKTPTGTDLRLRRLAEEKLSKDREADPETLSPEDARQLLHELRVHQIELEMQNEELRRAQYDLEYSRARYFDLYDLAPIGYLTLNGKGLILEANLAAAAMLGAERSELVNLPINRLIFKEDQDIYYLHRKKLLESGEPQACELRMARKDETVFWSHLSASADRAPGTEPGQFDKGEPVVRVVLSDISKGKKADAALKKLNEDLEGRVSERTAELADNVEKLKVETGERVQAVESLREKDRMLIQQSRQAAMGEMIGNIAHQWRQPLNTLGLTIQQLPLYYDMGELTREFLENSVGKSMELIQHMSKTIDDFRNFFSPDKEKAEFNVREAIASTLKLTEDSLKIQHIEVELVARHEPVIHGFRNEFAQVVLNILNNARDVLTEREIKDPRVVITIGSEDGRAVVTISDNAGGIPEEIMGKIFDPYFTTKGPQQGTGVGLFMSKTIIEKNMGGRLTARNIAAGAEFRIEGPGSHTLRL